MNRALMLSGAVLVAMAAACSANEEASAQDGTMTVHGSVTTSLSIDNARAVAIGTDGRTFWAYVDRDRDFTLALPVGQSYRILVANQRATGGQKTIGHVVLGTGRSATEWIGANSPGDVDLGKLRLAGTSTTTSGVSPKCDCPSGSSEDGDKDDYSDDYGTKGGDTGTKSGGDTGSKAGGDTGSKGSGDTGGKGSGGDGAGGSGGDGAGGSGGDGAGGSLDPDDCDVCTDEADDKPLAPSKTPSKDCSDKDADKHGKKTYGDKKACASDSGKGAADPGPKSGGDTGSKTGGDTGSSGAEGGSKPAGGDSGSKTGGDTGSGGKAEGSKCMGSSECSSDCSCVASTCSKK